eukprot:XP_001707806.1 Hypothetical protein GL50803_101652 [Giardia lamblia ATCC 50803]
MYLEAARILSSSKNRISSIRCSIDMWVIPVCLQIVSNAPTSVIIRPIMNTNRYISVVMERCLGSLSCLLYRCQIDDLFSMGVE